MSKLIVVLGPESEETLNARKALMSFAAKRLQATCDRLQITFLLATRDGEPVTEETANAANGYVHLDGKARKERLPVRAQTILVGCEAERGFTKAAKVIPYQGEKGRLFDQVREFLDRDLPRLI